MAINYEKEYQKLANEFWELQQIEQTEEEKKYDDLCQELEKMAKEYRIEIDKLAEENASLHAQCENKFEVDKEYDECVEKEQILHSILSCF